MISLHVHYTNGKDSYRTVWRCDIDKATGQILIWEDANQAKPEELHDAVVQVFLPASHNPNSSYPASD